MAFFDFSLAILVLVNIFKSQQLQVPLSSSSSSSAAAAAWEWDPFHVVDDITWTKFWALSFLFFLLSFVSIRISLINNISPFNGNVIVVQFNRFSAIHMVSFWPLVFFPQALFWYIFPFIVILFTFTSCITGVLRLLLMSMHTVLSLVPNLNILITHHHINNNNNSNINIPQLPLVYNEPASPDGLDIEGSGTHHHDNITIATS